MVASVSFISDTSFCEKIKGNNFTILSSNNEMNDSIETLNFTKETAFEVLTRAKIGGYESFKQEYQILTGKENTTEDFEVLYSEYMKSRGCNSEEELSTLNSVNVADCGTVDELKVTAKNKLMQSLLILATIGFDTSDISENLDKIVNSASVKQLADYVNKCDIAEKNNCKNGLLSATCDFFKSVSENSDIKSDKFLKNILNKIITKIENALKNQDENLTNNIDKTRFYNKKMLNSAYCQYGF